MEEHVDSGVSLRARSIPVERAGQALARPLEGHVPEGRDPACDRGERAAVEVVDPELVVRAGRRGRRQMDVDVDAAREHELAAGVDLAPAYHRAAELDDSPVEDADVGDAGASRRDDRTPADDEIERATGRTFDKSANYQSHV
jgi:hypothetical protein